MFARDHTKAFRAPLEIEETTINELSKPLLRQAEQMDGFLNLMIGALDSRPIFAAVGRFKRNTVIGGITQGPMPLGSVVKTEVRY